MSEKKKFELAEEKLQDVSGGAHDVNDMADFIEESENGPWDWNGLDSKKDSSGGAKNTTPVASSQKEVAQDVNVSGNSVPKYNNVNNGGKQMFVQQGKNTNKNTGVNKM